MRSTRLSPLMHLTLLLAALLLVGCGGPKKTKVEGKLTKGVQPFTLPAGQSLKLSFMGKGPNGQDVVYPADVNSADGTFVVNKVAGGIPPGKYKININLAAGGTDPDSLSRQEEMNQQFAVLNGKEIEIPDAPQNITIDTATGTITAAK